MPADRPRGRRRQREQVAVRITDLRQLRVVALHVVPENDPLALQPAALGRDVTDHKEHHAPAGDIVVGESATPHWSKSSHCISVSIGR